MKSFYLSILTPFRLLPFGLLLSPFLLCGQQDSSSIKVVHLPEVFISENREHFFNEDRSQQSFDEERITVHSQFDISDVLSRLSMANINSYGGAGGTATISIRGTASDHTAVLWNGFQINSITLGEMDLSLIPAESAEEATIVYSGASTLLGSGSFGGAILLDNKPDWDNKLNLSYRLKAGSFKYHGHHLNFMAGNQKVQYSLKAFYQGALNDFPFTDKYKAQQPEQAQTHNALENYGTVQNLYIKAKNRHEFEFGLWTQDKHKEIPPTMGRFGESNKLQDDFNFRFFGQWQKIYRKGRVQIRSAFMHDFLHYTDKEKSTDDDFLIDSRIKTKRVLNQAQYRHYFSKYLVGEVGAEFNTLIGDVVSYGRTVHENLGSLYLDLQPAFKEFSSNISVRQEIDNTIDYKRPLFSVGLQQSLFKKRVVLLVSYADKYRKPDFNERYWQPGGNVNLTPELGWGVDAGTKLAILKSTDSSHSLHFGVTYYYIIIKNGIVWKPSNESFWSPQNVNKTKTQGVENEWIYKTSFKTVKAALEARYHYNKTVNKITGRQLSYKPNHIVKTNFTLDHKHFIAGINWGYVSSRFSDESENEIFKLDGYQLLNVSVAGKYARKFATLILGFEVKNLTGSEYEVNRTYAQPGRAYYLNLTIKLNKSLTQPKT